MEPASRIITLLGGAAAVAKVTGAHRTRVWRWAEPKTKGGTDGAIPQRHIPRLLAHAARNDIKLTAADFFTLATEVAA